MANLMDSMMEKAESAWLSRWKAGPTRLRWDRIPLQVGDRAPDLELADQSGMPTHLNRFWANGPALLLFWRHFGCSCGIDRAKRLRDEYDSYTALGAAVVVIGQGEPERAAVFAQRHSLACPVLCDPEFRAYRAYDLLEGKPSQVVFDAPDEFLRREFAAGAKLAGSRHGTDRAAVDSPWQLPGEFVVDRSGTIRLAYRYQYCEDWPNPLVLIAALKESVWQEGK